MAFWKKKKYLKKIAGGRQHRKTKKRGIVWLIRLLLLLILSLGMGTASGLSDLPAESSSPAAVYSETALPEESSQLNITMLDVGQGLSVLMESDGHYLLYDGGGRDHSSYVVAYLKKHNITALDYVIVSHYDEDHLSGIVGVLSTTQVGETLSPDYEKDTKIYSSYRTKLEENGCPEYHPAVGEAFQLGNAGFTVVGPASYTSEDENDRSIAILVQYGNFSCLLTGDAESEEENAMLASGLLCDTDVYFAGHHGSSSSSSEEFLDAIKPEYVMISCGEGNSYGHPTQRTLSALQNLGSQIFRSDKQGEVTVTSNGTEYWFSTSPCEDWTPG